MRKIFISSKRTIYQSLFLLFATGMFGLSNAQEYDWKWAESYGGNQHDRAVDVTSDFMGNVYAVGTFGSLTINFGSIQLVNQGETDFYLVKYDYLGNPVNALSFGSASIEGGMGVDTDNAGNVYVIGYFTGETFTIGTTTLTNQDVGETSDFFIAKFNSNLEFQWAKSAGSSVGDGANRIAVDGAGNSYITGYFGGNEMFFETITLNSYGAVDIFTAKYDTDGNEVWVVGAGGTGFEQGMDISIDLDGNSYVTGYFSSPTVTFGFTDITNSGINDIYVVKYDENGIEQWVKAIGGSSYEGGTGISNDDDGNVYITGYFNSASLDFGNGVQTTNNGNQSLYVAKFNTDGDALWANSSKGNGLYMAENIAAARDGSRFLIVGEFNDSAFGFDDLTFTNQGGDDAFLIEFDDNGNATGAESIGGSDYEQCKGLHVDDYYAVYIAGGFSSSSVEVGSFTLTNPNPTKDDAFVARRGGDLGVSDVSNPAIIQVYPNPSNGTFNLKSDSNIKSVEVLNMTGQLIYASKVSAKDFEINLQSRPAGVYILKVQTDKGSEVKKLIIRH